MPLYIAKSGDLDRCYGLTTLKDRATQLRIKYKSGALVTQYKQKVVLVFASCLVLTLLTGRANNTFSFCLIERSITILIKTANLSGRKMWKPVRVFVKTLFRLEWLTNETFIFPIHICTFIGL